MQFLSLANVPEKPVNIWRSVLISSRSLPPVIGDRTLASVREKLVNIEVCTDFKPVSSSGDRGQNSCTAGWSGSVR